MLAAPTPLVLPSLRPTGVLLQSGPGALLSPAPLLAAALVSPAVLPAPSVVPSAIPAEAIPASWAGLGLAETSLAEGPLQAARLGASQAVSKVLGEVGFQAAAPRDELPAASAGKVSYDYGTMFDLARRMLTRPEVRAFLREAFKEELTLSEAQQKEYGLPERIKDVSESQFMLLLQHNPQAWPVLERYLKDMVKDDKKAKGDAVLHKEWRARMRELVADKRVAEVFSKFNDSLTPMSLETKAGAPGYSNAVVFANHQTMAGGKTTPAADLKKILIDFIGGAEKELMFNVFDFDLMDVADALIARAKAGVTIMGGIDKNVIAQRPGVKAVFDKLNGVKGITIRAVDSVGLNHQKIVIRDFNDEKKAGSLFSSGNFTQSCIGPEGDLSQVPAEKRPKDSVPNANHLMTVDGYLLAQVAANSLIKTLVQGLRGNEYPLGGAFKVEGEKIKGAAEAPWIIVSFSPNGGLGDINRDMTRRLILGTRGPLRLLQFAFSSEAVQEAIIERARLEKADGKTLDLKSVGDTPFAMRPWSVFLALAGYELEEKGEVKQYIEAAANALKKVLGAEAYEALRKNIRVAPEAYRTHHFEGTEYQAKLHHKVVISGGVAVLGTSFNFSEAANHNQEQFLVTSDASLVAAMTAVFDGFFSLTTKSIVEEVLKRNGFLRDGGEDDLKLDSQYQHVDEEAGRSRRKK